MFNGIECNDALRNQPVFRLVGVNTGGGGTRTGSFTPTPPPPTPYVERLLTCVRPPPPLPAGIWLGSAGPWAPKAP